MKHFLCKLIGLLLGYMSWAFGIILATSRSWTVWESRGSIIPIMHIGLWEVFYIQNFNISGGLLETVQEHIMNKSWAISDEIIYGQDLILLANFLKSVVLDFGTLALWVSWIKGQYPDFLQKCCKICALFLLLTSVCIAGVVTWNSTEDFSGKTTCDFPLTFPIKKEALTCRQLSYVFPLGITTACLSIISALKFLYEQGLLKPRSQVKPTTMAKSSKQSVN